MAKCDEMIAMIASTSISKLLAESEWIGGSGKKSESCPPSLRQSLWQIVLKLNI